MNIGTFLTPKQMNDIKLHGLHAYSVDLLEQTLTYTEFDKFLGDFDKKFTNEYSPVTSISRDWLFELFGFKGELRVNTDTQNTDCIYISEDGTRWITIELKHFSTRICKTNSDGSEGKSAYNNGYGYWNVGHKSWKFRTDGTRFDDDYAFLIITNSRNKELVEVIAVDNANMRELLDENMSPGYNGGSHPIALSYRHVKDFPHMIGNKAPPDFTSQIIEAALDAGLVFRKTAKGSFYVQGQRLSIGDSQIKAVQWLRQERTRGGVYERIFDVEKGL